MRAAQLPAPCPNRLEWHNLTKHTDISWKNDMEHLIITHSNAPATCDTDTHDLSSGVAFFTGEGITTSNQD